MSAFWSSTLLAELLLSEAAIAAVKRAIVMGMALLIPSIATAGATGVLLARKRKGRLVRTKLLRMPFVAVNGLLVLLPSAVFLSTKASAGEFDNLFFGVQLLELAGGAANITLMGLNMRDGWRITGRSRRCRSATPARDAVLGGDREALRSTIGRDHSTART
jgi:hypothetical protein